ncbi:MAG: acyl-CoA ligase (AMP-forming), exosortase A system-associated [Burkholderia sp.]|jgi:acyl-CoA ligase (AMP-forming) (exosortase A-associated)|uniref:acyl-CoA ligase (AMP-forming), exosortase A system-associated n=1 Tax=Burkholderia sp. TaxID=36773 RepID=UPI0025866E8D|nr:acyl-CoA ligase (AMP-forming), exosortase A system-associated [Burkholderia sp.]MCA3640382.1 acyl-CoA ligase (AMP-forming), exosortase A system-associated [Methylobacterium sp.]MCA3779103.1 acyl-CoA ligase (AMP-forming), exosortase A system-associated [Burkholderia sp.]MCA3787558.1 acyl-CoA ligase (AMP-forming), exosortase A system-associated [Burkholderia sp.]MCA3798587.1 acyl-CoA ligase (AMP-forming), exosortase A system-associated [Burkholderia sp.]MCA3800699.1 acyl-CoA ligase (AMP-formi
MRNLLDLVQATAHHAPDSEAIVFGDIRLSYRELAEHACALGHGISSLGIAPGARIGIFLDKRIETVVSLLGIVAARSVFVPINPLLKPQQVAHILRDSGASCLITTAMRARLLAESAPSDVGHTIVTDASDVVDHAFNGNEKIHGWSASISAGASQARPHDSEHPATSTIDTDLAAILYTSGSTGLPKGVMLSHRNLLEGAWSVAHYLGHTSADRILAALPLSFDAGLSQLTSAWAAGATTVLINYLSPHDVIDACTRERITAITGVPPLWMQLTRASWPDTARTTLRYFANTGGRMPVAVLQRLRALFPQAKPYLMYGLTEAFRSTYLNPVEVDHRPDSIGTAVPNARILVVRPDGSPCEPDEPGELVHVGASVTMGYWGDPVRTAARYRPSPEPKPGGAASDIAVWSGDLVRRDAQGFLYFIARNDAQIKSSGYRISPEEIEEAIHESGLVAEVAAVGVPDDALGETIALVVVPAVTPFRPQTLLSWCKQRLPSYMAPHRIVVQADIPRNANGKFDRAALRDGLASSQPEDQARPA